MKKAVILSLVFLGTFAHVCFSQSISWQRTDGPRGGIVLAMVSDPFTGRVWSGNGFYSSDNGNIWLAKPSGIQPGTGSHFAMAINDSGYLFTGNFQGSMRSHDGGETWQPMSLPGFPGILSFATYQSEVWAGSYQGKIFHSKDNGNIWEVVHDGTFFETDVYALSAFGKTIYAGTYGNGVQRSDDGGKTWTKMDNGMNHSGVESLQMGSANGNYLLAGTNGAIYSTASGGASWTEVNSNCGDCFAFAHYTKNGLSYAATSNGFFYSTNSADWIQSNIGLTNLDCRSITVDQRNGNLYLGTNGDGIFRSTNGGSSWQQVGTPVEVFSLTASGGNDILAGTNDGIFSTANGGVSWEKADSGMSSGYSDVLYTDPYNGRVYAGMHNGLFFSDNSGGSWISAGSGLTNHVFHAILSTGPNTLLAATNAGVFLSGDGGLSWTLRNSGFPDSVIWDSSVDAIAYDKAGSLYAVRGSGIYRSGDPAGNNWQLVTSTFPGNIVSLAVASDGSILAGTGSQGMYRSSNGGSTWNQIHSSITHTVTQIIIGSNNVLYAATLGDGIYASPDNGNSWEAVNSGLATLNIQSLIQSSDGYLWAGTADGGVWNSRISTSEVKEKRQSQSSFAVYPNPATDNFFIEASENATLEIYDPTGRLVQTEPLTERSKNELRIKFGGSGVYLLRITSKQGVETRSIAIAK